VQINHNLPALRALNSLNRVNVTADKHMRNLSSGLRINTAADDAAGMAISNKMRTQVRGLARAAMNSEDGISLVQTAEGALSEVHSMLQRVRELSVQGANGTLAPEDRRAIQMEVEQLKEEITSTANLTEFNKISLLDGQLDKRAFSDDNQVATVAYISDTVAAGNYELELTHIGLPARVEGQSVNAITPANALININGEETEILETDTTDEVFAKLRDLCERVDVTLTCDSTWGTATGGKLYLETKEAGSNQSIEIFSDNQSFLTELGLVDINGNLLPKFSGRDTQANVITTQNGFQNTATIIGKGNRLEITDSNYQKVYLDVSADQLSANSLVKLANKDIYDIDFDPLKIADGISITTNGYTNSATSLPDLVANINSDTHTNAHYQASLVGNTVRIEAIAGISTTISADELNPILSTLSVIQTTPNSTGVKGKAVYNANDLLNAGTVEVYGHTFTKLNSVTDITSLANSISADTSLTVSVVNPTTLNISPIPNGTGYSPYYTLSNYLFLNGSVYNIDASGNVDLSSISDYTSINSAETQLGYKTSVSSINDILTYFNTNSLCDVTYNSTNNTVTFTEKNPEGWNKPIDILSVNPISSSFSIPKGEPEYVIDISSVNRDKGIIINGTLFDGKTHLYYDTDVVSEINLATSSNYCAQIVNTSLILTERNSITSYPTPVVECYVNHPQPVLYTYIPSSSGELITPEDININVLDAGPLQLQVGANEGMKVEIQIPKLTSTALGLDFINLRTEQGANEAISLCDTAIAEISAIRSKLGAYQNRLEYTINNLNATTENTTAALSRIEDADMAYEMAEYTQKNVISQAGMNMLSKANQRPQQVLQLLQ
jgi:flagellin